MKARLSGWSMIGLFGLGLILVMAMTLGMPAWVTRAYSPSADVGGEITTDTTWTLAGSPYTVTSNVTVQTGVTLTVEPGVERTLQRSHWSVCVGGDTRRRHGHPTNHVHQYFGYACPRAMDGRLLRGHER